MDASVNSSPPTAVSSGNVTDTQVAFMVECYLRDCHFTKTLDQFRSEAARVLQPLKSVNLSIHPFDQNNLLARSFNQSLCGIDRWVLASFF
jgi:hypothetical protein